MNALELCQKLNDGRVELQVVSAEQNAAIWRSHIDFVSRHAFETAKIAQSFAAGWYNRHARDAMPTDDEISSFLSIAFGKLREDLRREKTEFIPRTEVTMGTSYRAETI